MYQAPDAISSLLQQHLVHAIVVAELLQLQDVAQQALQALSAAAAATQGLAPETLQAMASLETWPAGLKELLPLLVKNTACCKDSSADLAAIQAADTDNSVQNMLVGALGDLQGVWSSAEEKALLLALPLPAMQLLLSSDLVRVPSEDTVMYTAMQYVQAQPQPANKAAAKAALAPLIRAPQLSAFALYWAALAASSSQHLLSSYAQQLHGLQFLKMIASPEEPVTESEAVQGAPVSWGLGARQIRPLLDGVRLSWRVTVELLKQACKESFAEQDMVFINSMTSSSACSPPMGGVAWSMSIRCRQCEGGTEVGLYVRPVAGELPAGSYYKFNCTVEWQGVQATESSSCVKSPQVWGYSNYFELQPMSAAGGWDEAAWAAAADGMPTTGEMLLQLHMHSVCAT
jgi:hypothetical protein